jgi:hypothetical protein
MRGTKWRRISSVLQILQERLPIWVACTRLHLQGRILGDDHQGDIETADLLVCLVSIVITALSLAQEREVMRFHEFQRLMQQLRSEAEGLETVHQGLEVHDRFSNQSLLFSVFISFWCCLNPIFDLIGLKLYRVMHEFLRRAWWFQDLSDHLWGS